MDIHPTQSMKITAAADIFINKQIRGNPDQLYRARVLVFTLLAQLGLHAILLLGVMLSPLLSDSYDVVLPVSIGSCAVIIYSLYLLKIRGKYDTCCLLVVTQGFIAVAGAAVVTGGPSESPTAQLLAIPCLMTYFFMGLRWGVTFTAITIIAIICMIVMRALGFQFPQLTAEAFKPAAHAFTLILNFALVTALSLIYELTYFSIKNERDREHQKFVQLAKIDPLTGLANRRIFDEMLAARITLYSKLTPVRHFALCYLDLDKFKPINDQYGHDIGDEVLNAVSTRLRSALRGADFIGRHGGDEFMLLLDTVHNTAAATAVSQRFLQLVREPINTNAGVMHVDGSFGFALFPLHGTDDAALQKAADSAMYEAKRSRSGFRVYSPQPSQPARDEDSKDIS
jgi:diguanylate cyclase (GGDEF)-like protein